MSGLFVRDRMVGMKISSKQITSPKVDLGLTILAGLACASLGLFLFDGSMRVILLLFAVVNSLNAFNLYRNLRRNAA